MGNQMQPFNPEAKCAKCGSDDIHSKFCYRRVCWKWPNRIEGEQHMHRYCQICRYDWVEAPLDKKVDTNA